MPQLAAPPSEPVSRPPSVLQRVALVGNPNTGKTTVFNRLCGARAKTANFPGTTAAMRVGRGAVGAQTIEVVDLPGVYQLHLDAPETRIVRDLLAGRTKHTRPDAVVVLADASNLARNLILVGELVAARMPDRRLSQHDGRRGAAADRRRPARSRCAPRRDGRADGRVEGHRHGSAASGDCRHAREVVARVARGRARARRDLPGHRRVGRSRHGRDRQRRRERRRSVDRAARSRADAPGDRHARVRRRDGRALLDAVRAGHAADGSDRDHLQRTRIARARNICPPDRCAI